MQSPDDRRLVNDRVHDAQFSVSTRLTGYSRYGDGFNYLREGNMFVRWTRSASPMCGATAIAVTASITAR